MYVLLMFQVLLQLIILQQIFYQTANLKKNQLQSKYYYYTITDMMCFIIKNTIGISQTF